MPRFSLSLPWARTRLASAAVVVVAAVFALISGSGEAGAAPTAFSGAIVFERDAGPGSDIYVATTPKKAAPLVTTAAQEFDPAISSDGKVAFARAKGDHS